MTLATPKTLARRLALAASALAVGLAPAAADGADAPLRWKFQKGETIRYALVQKTDSKMSAGGNERGSTVDQRSDIRWVVQDVSPEGVATMTQVIERVRVKMEAPGQPGFEYDSDAKDKVQDSPVAKMLAPMFQALAGFECTLTMDPRGRIQSVKIPEKTLESLRGSLKGPLSEMFSEESMKKMITQSGLVLPEEPVEKGKGWTEESSTEAPQVGTIKTEKKYTYEGPDAKDPNLARIALEAEMTLQSKENPEVKVSIKEQKNAGFFLFDAAKGRIAESHIEVKMVQDVAAGPANFEQTVGNTMDMVLTPESAAK